MKAINDEFTDMINPKTGKPYSRQALYQMRMRKAGRCMICGKPEKSGGYCLKHQIQKREGMRKHSSCTRRNKGSSTYREKRKISDASEREVLIAVERLISDKSPATE